jgi:hypothetical protein
MVVKTSKKFTIASKYPVIALPDKDWCGEYLSTPGELLLDNSPVIEKPSDS